MNIEVDSGNRRQESGYRSQETGVRKQESGSRVQGRLVSGRQLPVKRTGNRQRRTGN